VVARQLLLERWRNLIASCEIIWRSCLFVLIVLVLVSYFSSLDYKVFEIFEDEDEHEDDEIRPGRGRTLRHFS